MGERTRRNFHFAWDLFRRVCEPLSPNLGGMPQKSFHTMAYVSTTSPDSHQDRHKCWWISATTAHQSYPCTTILCPSISDSLTLRCRLVLLASHFLFRPSLTWCPAIHISNMSWSQPQLKRGVDLQLQTAFDDGQWASVIRLAEKRLRTFNDPYYEVPRLTDPCSFDAAQLTPPRS